MKHKVNLTATFSEQEILELAKPKFQETRSMRSVIEWHVEELIERKELTHEDAESIKKLLHNYKNFIKWEQYK